MPYTTDDFPTSWKNLESSVRNKAIEIVNALIDAQDMDEDRAIPIALAQARKTLGDDEDGPSDQWVVPHEDGWAVTAEGASQATKVHDTKRDAVEHAARIARNQGSTVTVQRRDGTIEDRQSFRVRVT